MNTYRTKAKQQPRSMVYQIVIKSIYCHSALVCILTTPYIRMKPADKDIYIYISRHQKNQDFSKSGIHTSGFWARWLLWNLPTLQDSIRDVNKGFNMNVKRI